MTEEIKEAEHVDWRSRFRPKRSDERVGVLSKLLSSDKDNETKTRIPNVFGMSVLDLLGAWGSVKDYITYRFEDQEIHVDKTVEGLAQYFGHRYRVNAISAAGQSRQEYVSASMAFFLQSLQDMETGKDKRITDEGSRKK